MARRPAASGSAHLEAAKRLVNPGTGPSAPGPPSGCRYVTDAIADLPLALVAIERWPVLGGRSRPGRSARDAGAVLPTRGRRAVIVARSKTSP